MRYNILSRLAPRSYTATAAALAVGIYTGSLVVMNQRRPLALADSGTTTSTTAAAAAAAKQAVFGGGVGFPFVSLPLESADMVTHDTKRLRFRLPSPDAVSGLPLTCKHPLLLPDSSVVEKMRRELTDRQPPS
jgi:hypothetical protein